MIRGEMANTLVQGGWRSEGGWVGGSRGRPGLAEMRIEGNVGAYTRKASEGAERERGERIGFPRRFDKAVGRPFRPRVRNAVQHPRGSLSVSIAFSFALTSSPCLTSSLFPFCFVHDASCSLSLSLSCVSLTHMSLLFVPRFFLHTSCTLSNLVGKYIHGGVDVFEIKILLYTLYLFCIQNMYVYAR